jgi:dihydrofolate reductase
LTTTTNVSVDGVMPGLGAPDEDRRGGVDRGGWAMPLLDPDAGDHVNGVYGGADAFLFGRRTYEIFASSWGTGSWGQTHQGDNPISVALNTRPTSVVSSTLTEAKTAGLFFGDLRAQPRS